MDIQNLIDKALVYAFPVLFAITLHEAAHGYVARYFGDDTAYVQGRVTLNPFKHIDPIGTVLIPLLLLFATQGRFLFGYAKPVPVNFGRLGHPKRDMVWVALAGPATNFIQAILWALVFVGLVVSGQDGLLIEVAQAGMQINLVMWALNLFPLPPLDGGRVLVGVLPWRQGQFVARIEPYGFFIVLGLVYADIIGRFWILPLMRGGYALIGAFAQPLLELLR